MKRSDPEYMKEYYKKNENNIKKQQKEYYELHKQEIIDRVVANNTPDKQRKNYKKHYEKNKDKINKKARERYSELYLKRNYNLTIDEYAKMLDKQNGVCSICGEDDISNFIKGKRKLPLVVDHDHDTGKIRGLLCTLCNLTLGAARDNKNILKNSIRYLKKNGK